MRQFADDTEAQAGDPSQLAWPAPELLARFHHRLVSIHPFPNGNRRHARLAADLLAQAIGSPMPSWSGGANLSGETATRNMYLQALRDADAHGKYDSLIAFMWT